MNHYDDEKNIIETLQFADRSKIYYVNFSWGLMKFFNSIYRENLFRYWVNSSGKDELPPDFFSPKYKYMLEVMRIDDYVMNENAPNVLEGKFVKKVENILRENGIPSMKEANIQLVYVPDMTIASENNYITYVENFRRIVGKHLDKIEQYRNNHPGYKLGFLIFDESPAYIKLNNPNEMLRVGKGIYGYKHVFFKDKNFMEIFMDKDLDYIIWMTTCKNTAENPALYPIATVIDLKKHIKSGQEFIEYDYKEMKCIEVAN